MLVKLVCIICSLCVVCVVCISEAWGGGNGNIYCTVPYRIILITHPELTEPFLPPSPSYPEMKQSHGYCRKEKNWTLEKKRF